MDECEGGVEGRGGGRKEGGRRGRRKTLHPRPSMKAFWECGQLADPVAGGGRSYGGKTASVARSSTELS